jgi:hypothetical protein
VTDEEALAELKKLDPVSLKATLVDATTVPVAVPKVRNKWSRVLQVLGSFQWSRIEALDKHGMVLGAVERDDDDGPGEEPVSYEDGMSIERLARVMLQVMTTAQQETRRMFEAQTKGTADLVAALVEGVHNLSQSYQLSLQAQRAALLAEAGGQAGGNPEIMAMLQLAMSQLNKPPALPARETGK